MGRVGQEVHPTVFQYLEKLKYFLRVKVVESKNGIPISQRKYALDILEDNGMLDCRNVDILMDPNVKFIPV